MEKEVNAEPLNWVTQVQTLLSFEVWPKKWSSSVSTTRYNILGLTLTHATTGFKLQSAVSLKEWEELQHFEHLSYVIVWSSDGLNIPPKTLICSVFSLVTKVKCFNCDLATTFQTRTILKCIHFLNSHLHFNGYHLIPLDTWTSQEPPNSWCDRNMTLLSTSGCWCRWRHGCHLPWGRWAAKTAEPHPRQAS